MPSVTLPSGATVDYRDRLMAEDKIAVQAAIRATYRPDPADPRREIREVDGATDERMRVALLSRIITSWSFPGVPVPSQNIADPEQTIGTVLELDDYDALCAEVEPLFRRAAGLPKLPPKQEAPAETAPEAPPETLPET